MSTKINRNNMNSFGNIFRISIFGESHGAMVGVGIDGVPPGIPFSEEDMLPDLERRKPLKKGTTPRLESDAPIISSGVFNGFTTGAPIFIQFENNNVRSKDYSKVVDVPRPGHSDFIANKKFGGFNDYRGGGHFSGRLTLALVAAGCLAKKMIGEIHIDAKLIEAGGNSDIEEAVAQAMESGDSIGGIVECRCTDMPIGLGEPFFDSLESNLAHLIFAIPAMKGVEFGSGFACARMKGSEHNDLIVDDQGTTETNNAGGINGGVSNGNDLVFKVAVKPTSSIGKSQKTFDFNKNEVTELQIKGRHDLCLALRVPVVLEAVTAIVLADMVLMQNVNQAYEK